MRSFKLFLIIVSVLAAFPAAPSWGQENPVTEQIRELIDRLHETRELNIEGAKIGVADFVLNFYEDRQFREAWVNPKNVAALVEGIERSPDHGLNTADFHATALGSLLTSSDDSPKHRANLDILLTDAAARLLGQLFYGKVNPTSADTDWNLERPFLPGNPVDILQAALANIQFARLIEDAEIDHPFYFTLKAALRSHREIASSGGWRNVPKGQVLKPGMFDTRVPLIRLRLTHSGDFSGVSVDNGDSYDDSLVEAVKAFQRRHALDPDGVVGPATLAALNVPVGDRINQIRVNLERARWVLRDLENDFIAVNIAGFYVRLIRNDKQLWQTSAIVGKSYHKTPIFGDMMSYVVLNPTWTVTRNIIRNEIIPKTKKDPSYLNQHNFDLIDGAGQKISPASIDWPTVNARKFPYRVVQRAGPDNALGMVKFIFPNKHSVYLHDTPRRDLFSRSERAFSHGCIRVKDPLTLAELLLGDQSKWTRDKIDAVIEGGETTTVHLSRKLPVLLLYWTVDPDPTGNVRFYSDVYNRDEAVLKALDKSYLG
jgi:murein L,D-transpeptidase YcbB/YkuD